MPCSHGKMKSEIHQEQKSYETIIPSVAVILSKKVSWVGFLGPVITSSGFLNFVVVEVVKDGTISTSTFEQHLAGGTVLESFSLTFSWHPRVHCMMHEPYGLRSLWRPARTSKTLISKTWSIFETKKKAWLPGIASTNRMRQSPEWWLIFRQTLMAIVNPIRPQSTPRTKGLISNKLIRPYWGGPMVNKPLIRPYFWEGTLGGVGWLATKLVLLQCLPIIFHRLDGKKLQISSFHMSIHLLSSFFLLVVSTHLKNTSQNGNLPQIGVKIKNVWNHHLVFNLFFCTKQLVMTLMNPLEVMLKSMRNPRTS